MPDRAKQYCFNVLKKDSENVWALSEIGFINYSIKFYDSAVYYLHKALQLKKAGMFILDKNNELDPNSDHPDVSSDEIIYFLGLNYYYLRNLRAALFYFNNCITQKFRIEDAYLYRGAIYVETNKLDSGCNDLQQAKLMGNSSAESYLKKYYGINRTGQQVLGLGFGTTYDMLANQQVQGNKLPCTGTSNPPK